MDAPILRFVGLLRQRGVRVSPAETMDALRGLGAVPLERRDLVKTALRATLVKEGKDEPVFDELFEAFFSVDSSARRHGHGHDHDHDHDHDEPVPAVQVKVSEEPPDFDDPSHSHEKPADVAKYFEQSQLATAKRLHKDGTRIDLAGLSQELMLGQSKDAIDEAVQRLRHILHLRRLTNPGTPGDLALDGGEVVDADLSVGSFDHMPALPPGTVLDEAQVEALRQQVDGAIANLPEMLRRYLEKLMELERPVRAPEPTPAYVTAFNEEERHRMDLLLRRLGRELKGALSPRRNTAARGRIHASRTIRANMRYGGLPFRPVLVSKLQDRPRLILLVDVSLSVRNTAKFTIHLVHSLQSLFSQVRTFAFVSDLVEVTPYLERCELDEALGMIFGGEVLDVDANSDYGRALSIFHKEHLTAVNRRTTVLILGDGRGNGKPPHVWALEDVRRRARQLVWLTPEQERYWHLGRSDLPAYAKLCDRVELVRDLDQLESAAGSILRSSR
ncbi:MAG: VWA domain-containing protein [Solirubrobacteraceae bacterium]